MNLGGAWHLLDGTLSGQLRHLPPLFDKDGLPPRTKSEGLLFVPQLKLLLVGGDFERSFKRKEASRVGPVLPSGFEVQWLLRAE